MVQNERSSAFLTVTCSCGRGLRAKAEQAGTEVRCWDCHKMILVPIPNPGQRVARELSDGAMTVIQGPGLHLVFAAAVAVTMALAVPYYGVWCSAIVLMLGASAYGEIIRRVSLGFGSDEEPEMRWRDSLLPKSPLKFLLCALLATGTVIPLWLLNYGLHQSPHLDGIGWAALASTWTLVPLMMLMLYGRTEQDAALGIRTSLKFLTSHPFAILLALSVVPITLLLIELTLVLVLYIPGSLYFFALDYMPMPIINKIKPFIYNGVPHYDMMEFRAYPLAMFDKAYLDGLRHGYSFVGAVPASLSLPSRAGLDAYEMLGIYDWFYLLTRISFVLVIVTCLLAAFGVQARWLGSILALERRGKPA